MGNRYRQSVKEVRVQLLYALYAFIRAQVL